MIASILAWLSQSWFGSVVQAILSWIGAEQAAQNSANQAESTAEQQQQDDGAQSVSDQQSDDAQNQALDNIENQINNPTPINVQPPTTGGST